MRTFFARKFSIGSRSAGRKNRKEITRCFVRRTAHTFWQGHETKLRQGYDERNTGLFCSELLGEAGWTSQASSLYQNTRGGISIAASHVRKGTQFPTLINGMQRAKHRARSSDIATPRLRCGKSRNHPPGRYVNTSKRWEIAGA